MCDSSHASVFFFFFPGKVQSCFLITRIHVDRLNYEQRNFLFYTATLPFVFPSHLQLLASKTLQDLSVLSQKLDFKGPHVFVCFQYSCIVQWKRNQIALVLTATKQHCQYYSIIWQELHIRLLLVFDRCKTKYHIAVFKNSSLASLFFKFICLFS